MCIRDSLIAPATHPLAHRQRVALKALAGERFILRERGSGTRLATERHFAGAGFTPALTLELGSNEALKEAVAGHLGVVIVSRHALKADEIGRDLVLLPVSGFPIRSQWHLVHPRAKQLSPIAQVFREHLLRSAVQWAPS